MSEGKQQKPPAKSGALATAERTLEPVREAPLPSPGAGAGPAATDAEVEREIRRLSRRGFVWSGVAVLSGWAALHWLDTRRQDHGIPWPLRRGLEFNEQLARDYFRPTRLSPDNPSAVVGDRLNETIGMPDDFDLDSWELSVSGLATPPEDSDEDDPALTLKLADIKALPRVEMVTEFKCIEGWSQWVHWGGARLADFIAKYPPKRWDQDSDDSDTPPDVRRHPEDMVHYVSLATPDGEYYVGLEMESALHPQTLLCYEMNGKPLTLEHGAPLRLVIPSKYGVKNIKRIGSITYTDTRPADYWAERGYDWYAGL